MEKENYLSFAKKYFKTFSNKDIQGLGEMFDINCSLRDWEINVTGKDKVLEANKKIFDSVETIEVQAQNIYCDENIIIADLLITVNNMEKLLVVDIIEFSENGKIISIRAYKG